MTPPEAQTEQLNVLLVDDQPAVMDLLAKRLRKTGRFAVTTCIDSRQVKELVDRARYDAVVTDLDMPLFDGRKLLEQLVASHPELPVVVLTGHNDVPTAVACMRAGACDFITKPISPDHLIEVLGRATERQELSRENQRLRARLLQPSLASPEAFNGIITQEPALLGIFQYLEVIAPSAHPVLVTGETGTGKELIARAVQRLGRPDQPFVAVNAAGLDDTMFADTLFGHRKGAFTGAEAPRPGLIERAGAGTLFLDEIGDLSLMSQVKLLRLLQEQEYLPLGEDQPRRSQARFVVATCRTMDELKDPTRFRKDLYYRLKAHHVHLPPLRDRLRDIPLLAGHFLSDICEELRRPVAVLEPQALDVLVGHAFPGNIREMESLIRDAVSRATGGPLTAAHIRAALGSDLAAAAPPAAAPAAPGGGGLAIPERFPTLRQSSDQLIAEALRRAQGNHSAAARMLGITRQGLYNRLRAGALDPPEAAGGDEAT
jgi:two-component system nitrogen regulation response regulator GlnG